MRNRDSSDTALKSLASSFTVGGLSIFACTNIGFSGFRCNNPCEGSGNPGESWFLALFSYILKAYTACTFYLLSNLRSYDERYSVKIVRSRPA